MASVLPDADTVAPIASADQIVQPTRAQPQTLAATQAPAQVQTLAATQAPAQALASPSNPAEMISSTVPDVSAAMAPGRSPATNTNALSLSDHSDQTAALALPNITATAALAWSGSGDELVEAASLAAIQAFMQPGDLTSSDADGVRDAISTILAAVPCARLQTTFIPETGQLELRGHLPDDAMRGPVLAALAAQVGGAIPIADQLLVLPAPQCGALAGVAQAGLPQSTEQLTNPRVIGADGFARTYTYLEGQRLELELTAPDYDSFIYVDYFTADGNVIHLQPNSIVPLEFATAKSALTVGRDRGELPSLDITISEPFGQEIAVAFASSVALYEGLRPLVEPAEPYLTFLKERIAQARATVPEFKGEWVYFFISTKDAP